MLLLVSLLFSLVVSKEMPSFVHLCKKTDPNLNQCIKKTAAELRPYLVKGIPEFGWISIDPLKIQTLSANIKENSVNLILEMTDGVLYGLSKYHSDYVHANPQTGRFTTMLNFTELKVQGNYKLSGKALAFDVDGKGSLECNATDVLAHLDWFGNFVVKNNETYLEFDRISAKLIFKTTSVYFYNLFEGNDSSTETFNKAVNENIAAVKQELQHIIQKTIGDIALEYLNNLHKNFPVNGVYPE